MSKTKWGRALSAGAPPYASYTLPRLSLGLRAVLLVSVLFGLGFEAISQLKLCEAIRSDASRSAISVRSKADATSSHRLSSPLLRRYEIQR